MRKISFVVLLLFGTLAMAQPKLVPDQDIIKLGELLFQKPHKVVFGFRNEGDAPLVISGVHPSCGCTQVEFSKGPVAAGERGEIVATYDAAVLGTFSKFIEVYSNAGDEPVMMMMQGRVVTSTNADNSGEFPIDLGNVQMSTNYVEFDNVNIGDKPVAYLGIYNKERSAFCPELMHLPPYLTAEYLPGEIPGGGKGRIKLTLDSEKLSSLGLNQTNVYMARYLGDKVSEANEVLVSAVLLPAFSQLTAQQVANAPVMKLSEENIKIGPFGKKKEIAHTVKIRNNGRTELKIENIQVFNQAVSVSLSSRVVKPGSSARLKIYVNAELLKKAKARPRVLLVSNDPRNTVKRVNISVRK